MSKELTEIVDLQTVERLFAVLAVLMPILGLVFGRLWGSRNGQIALGTMRGLLVGLIGTANWLLWRVYNGITDRNGLDTVRNLAINAIVFVVAGILLGLVVRRFWRAPTVIEKREIDL